MKDEGESTKSIRITRILVKKLNESEGKENGSEWVEKTSKERAGGNEFNKEDGILRSRIRRDCCSGREA